VRPLDEARPADAHDEPAHRRESDDTADTKPPAMIAQRPSDSSIPRRRYWSSSQPEAGTTPPGSSPVRPVEAKTSIVTIRTERRVPPAVRRRLWASP
jgi:hypothetical protein